tara:strand:- start:287 stop:889 length:603 start_codon:yes stop_codon:yes gene_type:complete
MGNVTHVSTPSEINIASNLSFSRAKVFLESRFYIRDALSNLFDLNPLEIPLNSFPSKSPTLPKGMGYVSMSHCQDACIICWSKEKIGIDIEFSDRKLNYKGLAKKYFYKKFINDSNLNNYKILQEWNAIEAAIKWDRGKLSKDIKLWQYLNCERKIFHTKKKLLVNLNQFSFLKWIIAIASQNDIYPPINIICTDIKYMV